MAFYQRLFKLVSVYL